MSPPDFVSLDPERVGDNLNDDFTQDFPQFKGTKSLEEYLEALREEQEASRRQGRAAEEMRKDCEEKP